MIRIGIIGIAGRMGRLLAEEAATAGHTVTGLTRPSPSPAGEGRGEGAASTRSTAHASPHPLAPDLPALAASSDAVIDFTIASTVQAHAATLAAGHAAWILGTSGLSPADEHAVATAAERIPVVYSANFSPGITLLLELAARMAAALPGDAYDAEITEMHHRQKVDAPSGTAIALGRAVAQGRGIDLASHTEAGRDGHTGPRRPGAIGFASLRGGQVIGEHTLLFAGASEHIALTHRAFDRRVFAVGAIRAAAWASGRAPGLYSMANVMSV